jgi:glutathione synthase/RimK-type ligase-like ATP-grasp enzyme
LADIAIAYDRSETDELGIRLTAEEREIELEYLPFHKALIGFGNNELSYSTLGKDYLNVFEDIRVILNRTQSKSRRIFASHIFEALGKEVINPSNVELSCQSKIKTLATFYSKGIRIPKTVFIPANVKETDIRGKERDYSRIITNLISRELEGKMVLKPDAGTHGRGVRLVEGSDGLRESLQEIDPSIVNPVGIVAQEFIPKGFYDLRIIVVKKPRESPYCYPQALARGGFKGFRTNTFLGNMVFRADLPDPVREMAARCGEALSGGGDYWLIGLDAMPNIGEDLPMDVEEIKSYFNDLEEPFRLVNKVKGDPEKKRNFPSYSKRIEEAYHRYMDEGAYSEIKGLIDDTLEMKKEDILFHEGNACPEFWEQTRIVAGINLAEPLLDCAIDILDRSERV